MAYLLERQLVTDYHNIITTPMVYGQAMLLIALEEYSKWCEGIKQNG